MEAKRLYYQNYEEDFTFILRFPDGELPSYPWKLVFNTQVGQRRSADSFVASFDGAAYTNCDPVAGTPGAVLVKFKDHHLPPGRLFFRLLRNVPNDLFEDGRQKKVLPQATEWELTDGPTDGQTPPAVTVVLERMLRGESAFETFKRLNPESELTEEEYATDPVKAAVAAREACERIENTEAEISTSEEQRSKAEQGRTTSESTRAENEQRRISAEEGRARVEQGRVSAEKARAQAESQRTTAEQDRLRDERARIQAETSRERAEQERVQAETARGKHAEEVIAKTDTAAAKATDAAEAVIQLPVVRTDIIQTLAPEAQALARGNIAAAGALPVVVTLAGDNTLTVGTPLDTLTGHCRLFAAAPGANRWSIVLFDTEGTALEAVPADAVPTAGALLLLFRPVRLGQTWALWLTLDGDTVSSATVFAWRRDQQVGADTSAGHFTAAPIDTAPGDRSRQIAFTTGEDVITQQVLTNSYPLGLEISGGKLYVNAWGKWTASTEVRPGADYHVVVTLNAAERSVQLYVDDLTPITGTNAAAVAYSSSLVLGATPAGNLRFRGTVRLFRDFNFALSAGEVAALYNAGDPAGYIVPGAMKDRAGRSTTYGSIEAQFGSSVTEVKGNGYVDITITPGSSEQYPRFVTRKIDDKPYSGRILVEMEAECADEGGCVVWALTGLDRSTEQNVNRTVTRRAVYKWDGRTESWDGNLYQSIGDKRNAGKTLRIYSYTVTYLGCTAEYLPQNLVPAQGNHVNITGVNSYSWTGEEGQPGTFSVAVKPVIKKGAYKVTVVVSNYVQGHPRLFIGGPNTVYIPEGNGTYDIFAESSGGTGVITLYGTYAGVNGILTLTVKSIVPADNIASAWLDSASQLPAGDKPLLPLWGSAGGRDLTASGTPEIAYATARGEQPSVLDEVVAHSDCALEARIARLEAALVALTTGVMYVPKLSVRELEVWGANNLILTGAGAPTKAPDRAGQIYIDTKNNARYCATGNSAVSDWKNA